MYTRDEAVFDRKASHIEGKNQKNYTKGKPDLQY